MSNWIKMKQIVPWLNNDKNYEFKSSKTINQYKSFYDNFILKGKKNISVICLPLLLLVSLRDRNFLYAYYYYHFFFFFGKNLLSLLLIRAFWGSLISS